MKSELVEEMRGGRPLVVIRVRSLEGRRGDFVDHGGSSFAYGRADRGLTAISSHRRIAPHPKGRSNAEDASRRLVCSARNARPMRAGQGKEVGGERCGKRAACGVIAALSGRRAALCERVRRSKKQPSRRRWRALSGRRDEQPIAFSETTAFGRRCAPPASEAAGPWTLPKRSLPKLDLDQYQLTVFHKSDLRFTV
jgi:hypothetical protein